MTVTPLLSAGLCLSSEILTPGPSVPRWQKLILTGRRHFCLLYHNTTQTNRVLVRGITGSSMYQETNFSTKVIKAFASSKHTATLSNEICVSWWLKKNKPMWIRTWIFKRRREKSTLEKYTARFWEPLCHSSDISSISSSEVSQDVQPTVRLVTKLLQLYKHSALLTHEICQSLQMPIHLSHWNLIYSCCRLPENSWQPKKLHHVNELESQTHLNNRMYHRQLQIQLGKPESKEEASPIP